MVSNLSLCVASPKFELDSWEMGVRKWESLFFLFLALQLAFPRMNVPEQELYIAQLLGS